MDPLTQLETALARYYTKHPEPRSTADAPRVPLVDEPEEVPPFAGGPWDPADVESQRVEFEARAAWYGYSRDDRDWHPADDYGDA